MQGILSFETPSRKRRKTIRACQRCKDSKKRCDPVDSRQRCKRCKDDDVHFSLQAAPWLLRATSATTATSARRPPRDFNQNLPNMSPADIGLFQPEPVQDTIEAERPTWASPSTAETPVHSLFRSNETIGKRSEQRYATMLSLLEKSDDRGNQGKTTKLISGTNPLSALLGKDLKHKIVTNSCSFRTPDPTVGIGATVPRRGGTIHTYSWEQSYRSFGTPEARLVYLRALDCFTLPPPAQCAQLLEIYFAHVHPILPILDRGQLLSRYFGSGEPPSLVVLHAIFLTAYRYMPSSTQAEDGVSEIRSHCDSLHDRLHALIEAEVTTDRLAVAQASLLASLHWEGREGLNSAIDNLSLGIRIFQELGFHRKQKGLLVSERNADDQLQRRLWWCAYALDRFNAAQEGTPFLINEIDCDVDELSEKDFAGEDLLTRQATLINVSLAQIIEDAVRNLYAPGEDHTTLLTLRGLSRRQGLGLRLEQVAARVRDELMCGQDISACGLETTPPDTAALCGAFLLTHVDAVRILVHRPFILHEEPAGSNIYTSRDACRSHSIDILLRLEYLLSNDLLCFSWPFSVYAVVNCLLIFWYDISSPPSSEISELAQLRQKNYNSVVNLLRVMGTTWWAASAKYRLAQALAHAAGALRPSAVQVGTSTNTGHPGPNGMQLAEPLTPASGTQSESFTGLGNGLNGTIFEDGDTSDFWGSIGLDFDLDVANNIFSIGQFDSLH